MTDLHQGILRTGHNCRAILPADRFSMLVDGQSYFRAFCEALERAEKTVFIACWDIDSRIFLDPGGTDGRGSLRSFLEKTVARNRDLIIYILAWDFAMLYTLQREHLPLFKLGWRTSDRIHFHMDDEHPIGASHHQKFVVVDDTVAFLGGFDLTRGRWDTSSHLAEDPNRIDHTGSSYLPFHDVQVALDGPAAGELGRMFRDRWKKAGGVELKPRETEAGEDPWPRSFKPDFEDVSLGIALTRPPFRGMSPVRDIEKLYLDTISSARRYIYMENQYLTASVVVNALTRSLSETEGPEILIVLPLKSEGWLEEKTMNALRGRHIEELRKKDVHGRLRVFYPHIHDLGDGWINVHSKLLIADDEVCIFGSANLSNRSMGLDTECNVALEARGLDRIKSGIARLRNRLLGEHLGVTPEEFGKEMTEARSLIEAIEALRGGARTLRNIEINKDGSDYDAVLNEALIDPEQPVELDRFVDALFIEEQTPSSGVGRFLGIIGAVVLMVAMALAWQFTSLNELVDPKSVVEYLGSVSDSRPAPLVAVAVFVIAGLLSFPVTILFIASAMLFDTGIAFVVSMSGCVLSALVTYLAGRVLGRNYVRRFAGKHINTLSRKLAEKGLLTAALIRFFPSAPFSVVNFIAGASHINLRDYTLGTMLGMLPGVLTITLLGNTAVRLLLDPSMEKIVLFSVIVLLFVGAGIWFYRRSRPVGEDDY